MQAVGQGYVGRMTSGGLYKDRPLEGKICLKIDITLPRAAG